MKNNLFVKQEIFFKPFSKDKEILTFYISLPVNEWDFCRVFNKKSILLRESILSQKELEEELYARDTFYISGFLSVSHSKNIFSSISTNYTEYILNIENKKNFWESLSSIEKEILLKEIKETTNFNLEENPLSVFNKIVYSPLLSDISIKRKDYNSFYLRLDSDERKNFVVRTYFLVDKDIIVDFDEQIIETNKEYIVSSEKIWEHLNIEIFDENKKELLYRNSNITFIESIRFSIGVSYKEITTHLSTGQKVKIKSTISDRSTEIKRKIKDDRYELIKTYFYENSLLKQKIKKNRTFIFLGKDEKNIALEFMKNILENSSYFEKIYFLDPYIADFSRNDISDFLKLISSNLEVEKEILYSASKSEKNIHILKEEAENLRREIGIKNLNLKIYKTNENFHDRFLFTFSKELNSLKAYLFGTSFNSLGENFSSIVELGEAESSEVWEKLETLKRELVYEF